MVKLSLTATDLVTDLVKLMGWSMVKLSLTATRSLKG
jgi:hypothetical protein